MLTVLDLAKDLKVSRKTIYQTVKNPENKHLVFYKFPWGIRFEEKDIEKYKQHFKRN